MKTLAKEIEGETRERAADMTKRTKHSENRRDEKGKNNAQKPYECSAQKRPTRLAVHFALWTLSSFAIWVI